MPPRGGRGAISTSPYHTSLRTTQLPLLVENLPRGRSGRAAPAYEAHGRGYDDFIRLKRAASPDGDPEDSAAETR